MRWKLLIALAAAGFAISDSAVAQGRQRVVNVYNWSDYIDPAAIPDPAGRRVVFACRSGNRSVTASLIAQAAGLPYDAHLAGGMKAWKELGLPTAT